MITLQNLGSHFTQHISLRAMKGYRLCLSDPKKQFFNFRLKHFQTELDKLFYLCLEAGNVSTSYFPRRKDNLCCSCHFLGDIKIPSVRFIQYDNCDYVAHTQTITTESQSSYQILGLREHMD